MKGRNLRGEFPALPIPLFAIATALMLPFAAVAGPDDAEAKAGAEVYHTYCANCHGVKLVSSGQTFDLRRLAAADRQRFENSVLNGKNQMPPWRGALNEVEIDQIWHYIRSVNDEK